MERNWREGEGQTFATPRFSMAGILCPVVLVYDINGARLEKCSICSFQLVKRTSEIQFALFEGVEVGEGGLDELGC